MYRYHQVLYRRLLRGQSIEELRRLREESDLFPSLARLIEGELSRRAEDQRGWPGADLLRPAPRPLVPHAGAWPRS